MDKVTLDIDELPGERGHGARYPDNPHKFTHPMKLPKTVYEPIIYANTIVCDKCRKELTFGEFRTGECEGDEE